MVKKKEEKGVSKNLLAILLIMAILLSVIGTYMAIYNANAVRVVDVSPPDEGVVGIVVAGDKETGVDTGVG